jgi:hypothetical protein
MRGSAIVDGMTETGIMDDKVRGDVPVGTCEEDVSVCDVLIVGDVCGYEGVTNGDGVGGIRVGGDCR